MKKIIQSCIWVGMVCLISHPLISQSLASAQIIPSNGDEKSLQDGSLRSLTDVLEELQQEYEVLFSYEPNVVEGTKVKAIQFSTNSDSGESLEELLADYLTPLELNYKKLDNNLYVIFSKQKNKVKKVDKKPIIEEKESASSFNQPFLVHRPTALSAVEKTITGMVVDLENDEPLPGVNILVKGTSNGTVTNVDGNYRLVANDDATTLIFSSIGYASEEVPINGRSNIDVSLAPDIQSLSEVVVIGYGEQKRKDLSGSVASLSANTIQETPNVSFEQALQGRVAGVQITAASNAPGGGISMRIRGGNSISASNEPLYVVDGIQINANNAQSSPGTSDALSFNSNDPPGNALSNINPNDIESIEILKDASATAIYGSRGANGVVIITTKQGQAGQNTVGYETFVAFQEAASKLDVLDRDGYSQYYEDLLIGRDRGEEFPSDVLQLAANTDWQDEIFRTAIMQNHQLNFTGGNGKLNYNASANYFDQDGVVIGTGFKRYTARLNLNGQINDRISFGNNFSFTHSIREAGQVNGNGFRNDDIVFSALATPPWVPVRDAEGFLTISPRDWEESNNLDLPRSLGRNDNPLLVAREAINNISTNRALGNIFAQVEVAEGLRAKVSIGGDFTDASRNFYLPSTLRRSGNEGLAVVSNVRNITWINTNTLTYNRLINEDHSLTILGGLEFQQNVNKRQLSEASNFFTDAFEDNALGAAEEFERPQSELTDWSLMSLFARVNYILKDRYIFTATARADGSSRFGSENRWGYFPSGAFAWRISDEPFLEGNNAVSNAKLRVSYGLTGNTDIGAYRSLATYQPTTSYIFGGQLVPGVAPGNIANPDLKWERTSQFNVGADFGFASDRVSLTVDYYTKTTEDLLLNRAIPASSGFTTSLQNIGSVQNSGFEFSLSTQNVAQNRFSWTTDANITFNRNEVLDLGDDTELTFTTRTGRVNDPQTIILREGEPIGSFYGYQFDGIWQSQEEIDASTVNYGNPDPGDVRLADTNGDGQLNADDKIIIGNAVPDFIYGINNNFTFGNIDFSVFLQGSYGNDVLNFNNGDLLYMGLGGRENKLAGVRNSWQPGRTTNETTQVPQIGSGQNGPLDTRFIEDGSYLRIRNVLLGYNFPVQNIDWLGQLRFYVSAQNLFTFTDYSGYDPEVNVGGQSNVVRGVDFVGLPTIRSYTIGLNVRFQ